MRPSSGSRACTTRATLLRILRTVPRGSSTGTLCCTMRADRSTRSGRATRPFSSIRSATAFRSSRGSTTSGTFQSFFRSARAEPTLSSQALPRRFWPCRSSPSTAPSW
eukprot:Amastigsp_a841487_26.p4 type:complete len:108 gc:universal Amastigsp_a841487_26:1157-1480(+)